MSREIREIPPTPRRVKWRAVLWCWWPLAFAGFLLGIYCGLVTLMLFLAFGGKPADDKALLAGPNGHAVGIVDKVDGGQGTQPLRVRYRFPISEAEEVPGRCFPQRTGIAVGDKVEVEYLLRAPHKNRVVGGRISLAPPLHYTFLWFFLTGVACLVVWMIAVLRLRRMMNHGDIAAGKVLACTPIRFVNPSMLRVTYSYRDHHANERNGHHWVRARSALGQRLQAHPERIAVVHDRNRGDNSRLVMGDDFVVQQSGHAAPDGAQT